ncbi:MAG: MMPL family transporter [Pseudomonadota bacterium]|nr:MMPL family transporter [Pseudomonadota bacterium]
MTNDLPDLLVRKRLWLSALTIAVGIFIGLGIPQTEMDNSTNAILAQNDPYKPEIDQAKLDFPSSPSIFFAFESDPDVFTVDTLAAIESLNERYMEVDSAIAVGSLLNYPLNDADSAEQGRRYLIPELRSLTDDALAVVRRIALADEDLTKRILSRDGSMTLATVKYKLEDDTQAANLALADSAIRLRDSLRENFPKVRVYVTGEPLFMLDSHLAAERDNRVLFPLVTIIGVLLLWFCLKSLTASICLFVLTAATLVMTLGTHAWLGIALNQISRLGPLVVFVIALADGIHVVSVYAQELNKGLSKTAAMAQSLKINLRPVSLATVTTTMGFLSLNYCSSPAIYGFGNIIAIGVIWAFVLTFTLLPGLILLLPMDKVPKPLAVGGFIGWITRLVEARHSKLYWGGWVLIIGTLALLPLNKLDFNQYAFVDEGSDLHYVIKALRERIGNDQALAYVIRSNEYYGITKPEFLQDVNGFTEWLETQPEASFVATYTDYLRARNKADHDDDEAWDRLPTDQLTIIDYLVGYQLVQEIEPSLQPMFNTDYSGVRLVVGTSNLSNNEILAFAQRIDEWAAANVSPEFQITRGDNTILRARVQSVLSSELMQGFAMSFLLITLTMLVGLRSVRYGLLSLLPNLFPATIVFGFWGLFVGELSPYNLMLFSISIGLVVDDSVHVLSKYIAAKQQGQSVQESIRYSMDKAGSAITITTASLALGTFMLVFSNTEIFQNVALLITPIIVVALFLDLLFLPPLLMRFDRWMEKYARPVHG